MCVSFWRPDDVQVVDAISPAIMYDNGAFSEWMEALRRGEDWFIREDWTPYFRWLEPRIHVDGRWAVIPDAPGAPSQLNDALLGDWPFGDAGAPLWHMDGPIGRLLSLCDRYSRVCLGWTGVDKDKRVGCEAWFRRMDEVAAALGNTWPDLHMMRGVLVAREYPFTSADASSGAQNGWKYDAPLFADDDPYRGHRAYLDRLEAGRFTKSVHGRVRIDRERARGGRGASGARCSGDEAAFQLGLL